MPQRAKVPPPDRLTPQPAGHLADTLTPSEREARLVQRRIAALNDLLQRREDLRGAYAPADFFADAVRWTA